MDRGPGGAATILLGGPARCGSLRVGVPENEAEQQSVFPPVAAWVRPAADCGCLEPSGPACLGAGHAAVGEAPNPAHTHTWP